MIGLVPMADGRSRRWRRSDESGPLIALLRELLRCVGGPLSRELAIRPFLVLLARPELRELGAAPRWREPGKICWGFEVVDVALHVLPLPASPDARPQVAHGLVDLVPLRPARASRAVTLC
jgi:hypothetical protein